MTPAAELAIDAHLRELDQEGLAVLPPYLVNTLTPECVGLAGRLREVLGRLVREEKVLKQEERNGVRVVEVRDVRSEDPVFEQAVGHPAVVAIAGSRLGEEFQLRTCSPLVRPAERRVGVGQLHCDSVPWQGTTAVTFIWALSEHDRKNGTLCYVPGSHRLVRMPGQREGTDEIVTVDAPSGSLLAFDGLLWHGTWPRSIPGTRLGLVCVFRSS